LDPILMQVDGDDGSATMPSVLAGYETLLAFQESFEAPEGVSIREFMKASVDLMNAYPPPDCSTADVLIREVAGWQLRATVTTPDTSAAPPVIVFFHGGGWSMGNPATHRRLAMDLTLSGCVVVSVDYRRLPRHRFPAQIDDAMLAVEWVAAQGEQHGWDTSRIVLAGDSAGATLAAVAGQSFGVSGSHAIRALLLFYGIFDYHEAVDLLQPAVLRHAQEAGTGYLSPDEFESLRNDPRVSPLHGCSALPATYLSVGAKDPLLSQSRAMAAALDKDGIANELRVLPGAPHGFMQLPFLGSYLAGQLSAHSFLRSHLELPLT
jgi:acetyl esterase